MSAFQSLHEQAVGRHPGRDGLEGGRPSADVVDAARHLNENIQTLWSEEGLALTGCENATRRFFVRVSGNRSEYASKIQEEFGAVDFIEIEEDKEGFGFVTPALAEKSFDERLAAIPNVTGRIRLE